MAREAQAARARWRAEAHRPDADAGSWLRRRDRIRWEREAMGPRSDASPEAMARAATDAPPSAPLAPSARPAARWRWAFGLVAALALALRVWRLPVHEPWLDEACSLLQAERPTLELLTSTWTSAASPHPPLFFVLLKAATAALGDDLIAARLVSLCAGLASVALVSVAGRRLAGPRGGLLAGLVAALSPLAIHYSVEIRGYALLAAAAMAFALSLADACAGDDRDDDSTGDDSTGDDSTGGDSIGDDSTGDDSTGDDDVTRGDDAPRRTRSARAAWTLAAATLALTLTHFYGLLLTPLALVALGLHGKRARRATLVVGAASLPAAALALGAAVRGMGGVGWLSAPTSLVDAAARSIRAMALGTTLPSHLRDAGFVQLPALSDAAGVALLALSVAAALIVGSRRAGRLRTLTHLLGAMAALAIGLPLLLSLWRPLALPGRYEIAAMGPLHALMGAGMAIGADRLGARWRDHSATIATWALAVLCLALGGTHLTRWAALNTQQPYEVLSRQIAARAPTAGDGALLVVHTDLTLPPVRWQLAPARQPKPMQTIMTAFPPALLDHPCWQDPTSTGRAQGSGDPKAIGPTPADATAADGQGLDARATAWVRRLGDGEATAFGGAAITPPRELLVVFRLDDGQPRPAGMALLRALAKAGWRQGDGGAVGDYGLLAWIAGDRGP